MAYYWDDGGIWYVQPFRFVVRWKLILDAPADQWIGGVGPERDHVSKSEPLTLPFVRNAMADAFPVFLNKSAKMAPYLSAPYRDLNTSIVQRFRCSLVQIQIPDTEGRHIDLAPFPDFIDDCGVVHFKDNDRPEYHRIKDEKTKPDIVVLCTGYKQVFPFWNNQQEHSDWNGKPYPTAADANVRDIWRRDDPSIGFIGFVRPSLGAIPPISEMQAQLWILQIAAPARIRRPLGVDDETHYRLKPATNARIQYGRSHRSNTSYPCTLLTITRC